MCDFTFKKELYPRVALLKAAYCFSDRAYVHLDADNEYYLVNIESKSADAVDEKGFINELLAQTLRHEVYLETKNIRELMLARAMATTVIADTDIDEDISEREHFSEADILKDWFSDTDEDVDC